MKKIATFLVELRLERLHSDRRLFGKKATQGQIAAMAGIDPHTLRNIEVGKAIPKPNTLQAIMAALDAFIPLTIATQQTVLQAYGLSSETGEKTKDLPDETSVQEAIKIWQKNPGTLNYLSPAPAFLTDISHRLLDYNAMFVKIIDTPPDHPRLTGLRGKTLYDLVFDFCPWALKGEFPVNAGESLPAMVTSWKHELWTYRRQEWYWTRVAEARNRYPEFRRLWDDVPDGPPPFPPTGSATRIAARYKQNANLLMFGVLSVNITTDDRLRIVQLVPLDQSTRLLCEVAALEAGKS